MPDPDSTPFTDAPFALKALWNKFALRCELDPHDPPATVREAYNQVVAVHLTEMRETVEAIEADIRNAETDMLASAGPPDQATCVRCGARHLEHFYTSRVGGSTLCAGCFQGRVGRGAARRGKPTSITVDTSSFLRRPAGHSLFGFHLRASRRASSV